MKHIYQIFWYGLAAIFFISAFMRKFGMIDPFTDYEISTMITIQFALISIMARFTFAGDEDGNQNED